MTTSAKGKFRKTIRRFHLWLGFTSGLVVFISMLGATVFVWEEELRNFFYSDLVFVKEVKAHAQPLSTLLSEAQKAVPDSPLTHVEISREKNQAYIFSNYKKSDTPSFSWMSEMEHMDLVFVDPYSGKVLGRIDKRYDWIFMSRMLHQCLLIRSDVGHYIVGYSTLIMFIMVITGLILWFPKNKAALKQRLKIKWNAKWRRVNYDIHNVGGFYTYILIIFFAATGLVWTFKWWTNGIYILLNTDPKKVWESHAPIEIDQPIQPLALDKALHDVIQRKKTWTRLGMEFPENEDKNKEISVFLRFASESLWDTSDSYYYHPETGLLHATHLHKSKTTGAKWRNSNYAMHVGSIYGLPTKIIACFVAMFCASLPVTGFLIWFGRRQKKIVVAKELSPIYRRSQVIEKKIRARVS